MVVFGGAGSDVLFADLWAFAPKTLGWRRLGDNCAAGHAGQVDAAELGEVVRMVQDIAHDHVQQLGLLNA